MRSHPRFTPILSVLRSTIVLCAGQLAFAAAHAAEPEPLVKVGEYHLKRARYGAAVVAEGDYLYVLGGCNVREFFGDIERFNVKTHALVRITENLIPRRFPSAAVVNHQIYLIGGWNDDSADRSPETSVKSMDSYGRITFVPDGSNGNRFQKEPESSIQIFDLATGKITVAAPMQRARASAAAVVRQGKIMVIGGETLREASLVQTNTVEVYDPASNSWTAGLPMPTPRQACATVVGDFIIVPGGFRANAGSAMVEFFVPQENVWKALPDLCRRVSACSTAFLGENLFLFGNYGAPSEVIAYSLKARTSRPIKPGFTAARHSAAVVSGDHIYVVGGTSSDDGLGLDLIQVFALPGAK